MPVVISPHYYYPQATTAWEFEGTLEKGHALDRHVRPAGASSTPPGLEGSGADFMAGVQGLHLRRQDDHRLAAQALRPGAERRRTAAAQAQGRPDHARRHVRQSLRRKSHMREFIEQGFEVAVVRDATAGAKVPEGDGYLAALINFRMIANAVWSTDEAVGAHPGARRLTAQARIQTASTRSAAGPRDRLAHRLPKPPKSFGGPPHGLTAGSSPQPKTENPIEKGNSEMKTPSKR